ncbi:MAG: DUF4224 domain-containing protein [Gammaproteobacteria bacterium]|nr:DUF4224 domain-containing protein [Gammaproteobacteria bacterium]
MKERQRILLTREELAEITGYSRSTSQAAWFLNNGISHRTRGDGSIVVLRKHFEEEMGLLSGSKSANALEPDFSSLQ